MGVEVRSYSTDSSVCVYLRSFLPFSFFFFFSPRLVISIHRIDRFSSIDFSFHFLLPPRARWINFDGGLIGKRSRSFVAIGEARRIQIRQAYTCYYPVKLTFMDALLSTVRTFVLLSISWAQPKINGCSRQETSRRH